MIEQVANDVSNMLNKAIPSRDFDGLVGMENHIRKELEKRIARALYSKLSSNFTHTAFMESIRGSREKIYSDDYAFMLYLQEQFLSQTFTHKDLKIDHLGVTEERLKDKKVLVVIDDVDDLKYLKAMACGSRIIITTNDKKILKEHGKNHTYHVDFPCSSEALEIFCLSAFDQKSPYVGFEELTMEIRGIAGNLPLSLNVYGSHLRGMSKEESIHELPRLRTSLDGNIEKVLRCNYEALCENDKELFLHIACFFNGKKTSYLEKYLSNLDVTHGLQVLAEKSLISIYKGARLVMHNLLEKLGKEIVHKEYKDENRKHKFFVDAREICDELTDNSISFHSIEKRTYEIMSPSPLPSSSTHQVFSSFCGVDVRKGILSHIHKAFERKAITLFFDNDIERSKSIGPELIEAIKGSRISVVLISKSYASSTWCMDELVGDHEV